MVLQGLARFLGQCYQMKQIPPSPGVIQPVFSKQKRMSKLAGRLGVGRWKRYPVSGCHSGFAVLRGMKAGTPPSEWRHMWEEGTLLNLPACEHVPVQDKMA